MHESDVCLLENSTRLCVLDVVAQSLPGNCALEQWFISDTFGGPFSLSRFYVIILPRKCEYSLIFRSSIYVRCRRLCKRKRAIMARVENRDNVLPWERYAFPALNFTFQFASLVSEDPLAAIKCVRQRERNSWHNNKRTARGFAITFNLPYLFAHILNGSTVLNIVAITRHGQTSYTVSRESYKFHRCENTLRSIVDRNYRFVVSFRRWFSPAVVISRDYKWRNEIHTGGMKQRKERRLLVSPIISTRCFLVVSSFRESIAYSLNGMER